MAFIVAGSCVVLFARCLSCALLMSSAVASVRKPLGLLVLDFVGVSFVFVAGVLSVLFLFANWFFSGSAIGCACLKLYTSWSAIFCRFVWTVGIIRKARAMTVVNVPRMMPPVALFLPRMLPLVFAISKYAMSPRSIAGTDRRIPGMKRNTEHEPRMIESFAYEDEAFELIASIAR